MASFTVNFQPDNISIQATGGTLLQAMITAGLHPDAPCGGKGTCGKCLITIDGNQALACQTFVDRNLIVEIHKQKESQILTRGITSPVVPDEKHRYAIAFDVGTTTVVAYLMDGISGELLAEKSCINPQAQYGADVISRIQHAITDCAALQNCIHTALYDLTLALSAKAGIDSRKITVACIAGNTAMHHLLLGIDPKPLITPPYMPKIAEAIELSDSELLPINGIIRVLPNIAGFVGGDTIGCMVATRFDETTELTLMIDIGTNGEMVIGDSSKRIACSTAAGPAFEGAKISCGMRGTAGAIDHVWLENSEPQYHVIGEEKALGLCGSGLLDLIAVLLEIGIIDESGFMEETKYQLANTDVILTQKDIREVQLAKAAIRAGIELLADRIGASVADIQKVYLAGAFGNYLDPASACRIGMIPPILEDRIIPIGNAAGEGAKLCALNQDQFAYSKALAAEIEFLELASLPQFQDRYVDALTFSEEDFP